ncbi:MAG: hypothetical protein HGJ94_13890 [Desulfosarcina sp.]|nr:hypothetical protein [Desulfosarcina sp.]
MDKPLYILSPCGTSLLTNLASAQHRKLIAENGNAKNPEDVAQEDRAILEDLLQEAEKVLLESNILKAGELSAELNSIIRVYDGKLEAKGDFHQLLCTDTWLGESTGRLIEKWLKKYEFVVDLKRQQDLQTTDLESFQFAMAEIVIWCEEVLQLYRKNYRIIFNLTGGFKSVQGFLQTLASFYADETVYTFERTNTLLRIPRLPIEMTAFGVIADNLQFFRCVNLGGAVAAAPENLPETLLLQIDGEQTLSPWGELIWRQNKKKLYSRKIYPSPLDSIKYGKHFLKSVEGLSSDRIAQVNEKIDVLCRMWLKTGRKNEWNPGSLDFKKLKGNPVPPSTHECDAWSDGDAKRIFIHIEDDTVLVLDKLGNALH